MNIAIGDEYGSRKSLLYMRLCQGSIATAGHLIAIRGNANEIRAVLTDGRREHEAVGRPPARMVRVFAENQAHAEFIAERLESIRHVADESQGLGLFVRSLVGMDRAAAKDAMAGFIADKPLAANQIEFINLVVDHLTEHGVVEPSRLYESPFTDLTPQGPDGLFSSVQVDELIRSLDAVRATAMAA